jgi:hypothetical protein
MKQANEILIHSESTNQRRSGRRLILFSAIYLFSTNSKKRYDVSVTYPRNDNLQQTIFNGIHQSCVSSPYTILLQQIVNNLHYSKEIVSNSFTYRYYYHYQLLTLLTATAPTIQLKFTLEVTTKFECVNLLNG